jgi:hypothetical protein
MKIKTKTRLTLNIVGEMYVLKFMRGFHHLISGNEEKGTDLMISAIENFRSTKDKKIILQYQNYYTEALARSKKRMAIRKLGSLKDRNDPKVDALNAQKFSLSAIHR